MSHPRARLLLLVALFVASACAPSVAPPGIGSPTPGEPPDASVPFYSPGPTPTPEDPAVLYARIEQQVQEIRGLKAKAPVSPKVLDEAGLIPAAEAVA